MATTRVTLLLVGGPLDIEMEPSELARLTKDWLTRPSGAQALRTANTYTVRRGTLVLELQILHDHIGGILAPPQS